MMTHTLEVMPASGLKRCTKCGALFFPEETIDRMNLRPCERADIVPFDGFKSPSMNTDAMDADDLAMPPRILYTLDPLSPRRETDAKGAALIDAWMREWKGGK